MLLASGLPCLHHPLFNSRRFERVTVDRYFLAIERDDPHFHEEATRALLHRLGALHVEVVWR